MNAVLFMNLFKNSPLIKSATIFILLIISVGIISPLLNRYSRADAQSIVTITEFPISASNIRAQFMVKGSDGNLWFTVNSGANEIGRITSSGIVSEFPTPSNNSSPEYITNGSDGNLWFTENNGGKIGRITPSGSITEYSTPTSGSEPKDIIGGNDGNLWFIEYHASKIGRITPRGVITEFPTPTTEVYGISGITNGSDGNLWFTEAQGSIGRITSTGVITEFPIPNNTFNHGQPIFITSGADGNVWFTESLTNNIGRITPGGVITEFSISTSSNIIPTQYIISGSDGNLWFTESDGKIDRITPSGTFTSFPIPTSSSSPQSITNGSDGNLWFTEEQSGKIGRITPNGTITEYSIPNNSSGPQYITSGADGNVWFTENNANNIGRVDLTNGTITPTIPPIVTLTPTPKAVKLWETTADKTQLLTLQPDMTFTPDSGTNSNRITITVDENIQYQKTDGVGATITDSSAWLIQKKLSSAQHQILMTDLFDPNQGAGLSYIRQPIGASDFALNNYTYDDMPSGKEDPNLNNFSINHDLANIIPLLKQALQINSGIKIIGSPWSPPAWMKAHSPIKLPVKLPFTNTNCVNSIRPTGSLNGGSLKTSAYYAYAKYFREYIKGYATQGLPIDAITVQNEPGNSTCDYPSMNLTPTEEANFVGGYLGPVFANAGIKTKIVAYDWNWGKPYNTKQGVQYEYPLGNKSFYPLTVLENASARQYISGIAFHCYDWSNGTRVESQGYLHDTYKILYGKPSTDIYFTECSGSVGSSFSGDLKWDTENLVIGSFRNWARTTQTFNIALDSNNGPTNGGCLTCRGVVTIDQKTGGITKNVEYYVLGQVGKVVEPGAVRIASDPSVSGGIENVAFLNPDGSKALIVLNASSTLQGFKVKWSNKSFYYYPLLPAGAVVSFKWK